MGKNLIIILTGTFIVNNQDIAHPFTARICTNVESQEMKFIPRFTSSMMCLYKRSLILKHKPSSQLKSMSFYNSALWIKKLCKGLSNKIPAILTRVTLFLYFAKITSNPWSMSMWKKFSYAGSHLKITKRWIKSNKEWNNCTRYFITENQLHNYKDKFNLNICLKSKENSFSIMRWSRKDRRMTLQDASGENKIKEFCKIW